jgi:hypothetical protein
LTAISACNSLKNNHTGIAGSSTSKNVFNGDFMCIILLVILTTCVNLHSKPSTPERHQKLIHKTKTKRPLTVAEYQDCLRAVQRYEKELYAALAPIVQSSASKMAEKISTADTGLIADIDHIIADYATNIIEPLSIIVGNQNISSFVSRWNRLQQTFNDLNDRLEKIPSKKDVLSTLKLAWPHPASVKKQWADKGFQQKRYASLPLIADTVECSVCKAMEFDLASWKNPQHCHNKDCRLSVPFKYGQGLGKSPSEEQLINHVLQCFDCLTKKRKADWTSVVELTDQEKQNIAPFISAWGTFRTIASQLPGHITLLYKIEEENQDFAVAESA